MESDDLEGCLTKARELGAVDARALHTAKIVTGEWVRWKCQYGCGGYKSNLCCPPFTPEPKRTRELLDSYRWAVLLHGENGAQIKSWVAQLEREMFLAGFHKAFGMGSGPCSLCHPCNLERCARPAEARPSMESCGIDVFATARNAGFPIRVVTDRADAQNCYGLLLLE
jgi:predicted metal-binding protein